jgi:tetratricopeptide (TPR) repeat protein
VALARALNDRPTLAAVLRDARAAYLAMDDLDERLALDLETLALGYETGDKLATLEALRRLAGERIEQGELDAALGHIDQLERLADELRQGHRRWWTLGLRASIASVRGHFAEAERLLDEADAVAAASGDPNGPAMAGMFRVSHAWTSMRPDQLARGRADVLRALPSRGFADDQILAVIVDVGLTVDRDEARALLHRLPFERYHPRFNGQHLMSFLLSRAGRTDALPVVYERLRPWASRFPFATGCQGSYSGFLAMMAEAMGRGEDARRHFAHAIAENRRVGARPEVARVAATYARFLEGAGGASAEVAALRGEAVAIARELGMPALLAQLGEVPTAGVVAPAVVAAHDVISDPKFTLEGEYWTVDYAGETFRFKDSKAFQIVAYLVRNPGREFHVLHLAGVAAGSEGGEVLIEGAVGSGPDIEARTLYRERVEDLRATLAEAEANGDLGRAERAREELDFIADELSRGTGLGGRERASGSSAERARINIQRRIANAIKKIGEASPELGRRLGRGIRTGAYCAWQE